MLFLSSLLPSLLFSALHLSLEFTRRQKPLQTAIVSAFFAFEIHVKNFLFSPFFLLQFFPVSFFSVFFLGVLLETHQSCGWRYGCCGRAYPTVEEEGRKKSSGEKREEGNCTVETA
jgi:hypothetical protein